MSSSIPAAAGHPTGGPTPPRRPAVAALSSCVLLLLLALAPLPAAALAEGAGEPEAPPSAVPPPADPEEASPPADPPEDPAAPAASFEQRLTVTAVAPELAIDRVPGGELETGADLDAVEHLRSQPGLAAARRGGLNLDPQVRGLSEAQVATLVDGTRTFAAGPGRMDSGLSHVSPHAVASVEVVKGPYALTWGAGALAAIRFESLRLPFSSGPPSWSAAGGARFAGNSDSLDLFGRAATGTGRFRVLLLANDRSGGDYESGSGIEVPADFDSTEARLELGWQATDALLLDVDGGYQDQHDLDYAGRQLDATYFKTRSYALRGAWTPPAEAVDAVSGLLYSNRKDHRMNNDAKPTARPMPGRVPPFGLDVDLPTESNTAGGRLAMEGRRGVVSWTAGADGYRAEHDARRTIRRRDDGRLLFADVAWPDALVEDVGSFVQGRTGTDRFTLAAALRFDRWSAEARQEVSPFFAAQSGSPRRRDESLWSAAVSGRLALGNGGTGHALSFGIGRAVRPPTALELYSDRFPSTRFQINAELLGDPSLDPETSIQVDLGWSWQGGRAGSDWRLAVDGFARRLDDVVTVRPDASLPRRLPMSPPVVYRYVNGTRADFLGAEASLDAALARDWRLHAHASWIRGDEELPSGDEPMFGLPPLDGRIALRWQPTAPGRPAWVGRTWVDAALRHAEPQDRVARSRLEQETAGWTTLDLAAGHSFGDRWSLSLGVDNLLDEAYAEHLNALNPFTGERVEEPGRSWFARLEMEL